MENDPTSLSKLHDIVVPEPVGAWPPAPGWWVVIALALVWCAILVARLLARHRRNAYRRAGLAELAQFEKGESRLAELSVLLKRVALAAWPREEVASLSGEAWLRFLDTTGSTKDFTSGPGSALGKAAIADTSIPSESLPAILACCRRWITGHALSPPPDLAVESGDPQK